MQKTHTCNSDLILCDSCQLKAKRLYSHTIYYSMMELHNIIAFGKANSTEFELSDWQTWIALQKKKFLNETHISAQNANPLQYAESVLMVFLHNPSQPH